MAVAVLRVLVLAVILTAATGPAAAFAEAASQQEHVLAGMLRDGRSFRVRAQAALALGRFQSTDTQVALEGALRDRHVAVRVAAARALADAGARRSVPALRAAVADSAPEVSARAKDALRAIAAREGASSTASTKARDVSTRGERAVTAMQRLRGARRAIVLGTMENRSSFAGSDLPQALGDQVAAALRSLAGVAVLREHELTAEVQGELARQKLPTYRLEGNVQSIEASTQASERRVRCQVSLLLLDESSRALRSMMRGAATGVALKSGELAVQDRELAHKALRGAVRTAMSGASQAIESARAGYDVSKPPEEPEPGLRRVPGSLRAAR